MESQNLGGGGTAGVKVLPFDYSVENHFRAMDSIATLCGEEDSCIEDSEIERFSSSIKFIREWRFFNYDPRVIKFSSEACGAVDEDALGCITLSQFSSSTTPKIQDEEHDGSATAEQRKDFVMYVGGPVWALDWCPNVDRRPDSHIKQEFIAVAAHPPGSPYHKLGCPLIGRGIVQIWSVLNVVRNDKEATAVKKRKQKRKAVPAKKEKLAEPKRPRGRPRKNALAIVPFDSNSNGSQIVQDLTVQCPDKTLELTTTVDEVSEASQSPAIQSPTVQCPEKSHNEVAASLEDSKCLPSIEENEENRCLSVSINGSATQEMAVEGRSLEISSVVRHFPKDVALPRLVLCLAHNGKVAWDVKWRPIGNRQETECRHRMGYLAVVLGSGSLEVWEILIPRTMKHIYSCMKGEGTDARFVKMEPVFMCSKLTSGVTQSLPLTVEWSPSSSQHDYLIAGCHDGTVALWKFCASDSPKDTRPLLCFTADTLPIRALAWAPNGSESESANVIVTGGHGGIKFWDIRDPFRPLWDINFTPKIYSLDWPQDPRCIIFSYDDGTLKFISLSRSLNDLPVTGTRFVKTKQQGIHSFDCSSFPTWSVHVSRATGMVAYSSADGTVHHFELTSKAVDKDHTRYRSPHFRCVSVSAAEDGSTIILNSAPSDTPITLKKTHNVANHGKKSNTRKKSEGPDPDDKPLALCYESGEIESEEMAAESLKSKRQTNRESASGQKVMPGDSDRALVVRNRDEDKEEGSELKKVIDTLPPKIVAMHRVRWNLNKGSERWLCSGGAAGLLRCQEIRLWNYSGSKTNS